MSEHSPDPKRCDTCRGSGFVGVVTCSACSGSGKPRRIISREVRFDPPVPPTSNNTH